MKSYPRITVSDLSRQLDEGTATPVSIVGQMIEQTEHTQPELNAYITFAPEQALQEAARITEDIRKNGRKSALHGIPFAAKDLLFAKGLPATAGSRQMKDFIPEEDGAAVAAMKRAGAVLMGKTNTQEWGCGPAGDQSYFGPVHNPWDTARISGGSSSGSAAAVAAGMVPCALGSDAGGSIRIPAALCGIVGYKPSFGLVDGSGSFRGSLHLGCIGPMTNTVEDAAILMDALTSDPGESFRRAVSECGDLHGKHFTVPENLFADCIQPGVAATFWDCVRTLEAGGATVERTEIPFLAEIPTLSSAITFPEIAYLHAERLKADPDGYQPFIRSRIEKGFTYSAVEYIEALEKRKEYIAKWNALMQTTDAVLLPTVPITAYLLYQETMQIDGRPYNCSELLVRHTRAANVVGCPALSIPAGLADGLPTGVMLMGGIMQDAPLLALGALVERAQKK